MSYIDTMTATDRPQVREFAWACVEQNSLGEIVEAEMGEPDHGDMNEWDLTPNEWRQAISLACGFLNGEHD